MKTTLDLPDELMRAVKMKAAREDRKLKDVVAHLLREGLAQGTQTDRSRPQRVRFPLVECVHPADPEQEVTPDRVADLLLDEEARGVAGR